jgi:hypothetical protein
LADLLRGTLLDKRAGRRDLFDQRFFAKMVGTGDRTAGLEQ